jgi:hypothetical protein
MKHQEEQEENEQADLKINYSMIEQKEIQLKLTKILAELVVIISNGNWKFNHYFEREMTEFLFYHICNNSHLEMIRKITIFGITN